MVNRTLGVLNTARRCSGRSVLLHRTYSTPIDSGRRPELNDIKRNLCNHRREDEMPPRQAPIVMQPVERLNARMELKEQKHAGGGQRHVVYVHVGKKRKGKWLFGTTARERIDEILQEFNDLVEADFEAAFLSALSYGESCSYRSMDRSNSKTDAADAFCRRCS